MKWDDGPSLVAGIGTVLAVVLSLGQLAFERRQRRKLEHRAQSRLISAWLGTAEQVQGQWETPIILNNASTEPVYRAVASVVAIQGTAPHKGEDWKRRVDAQGLPAIATPHPSPVIAVAIIPPGRWRVIAAGKWTGFLSGRISAEVAFTDHSGNTHWVRRASGEIEELKLEPTAQMGLLAPFDWVTPSPEANGHQ